MIASQVLLSELQIPYNGSQQEINDLAGAFLLAYQAIKNGTYHSPANLPLPETLPGFELTPQQVAEGVTIAEAIAKLAQDAESLFAACVVSAMSTATQNYNSLYTSGKLGLIHDAVDVINALVPLDKQPIFVPSPDLMFLQSTAGIIGQVAQQCGDGGYFAYGGNDPYTEIVINNALTGTGPATMQPTVFPMR